MQFKNIITDRTWSLFLYTILFVFSITLVVGSPLAPNKNETMLLAVVDSSTFTPSHQPYLNWKNIKGTPTTTDYGSDHESDDGTNIPDDEHPYGPDDHSPLTVYDFYDSTGHRIECYVYRHGDGKEFGFSPFDLDPNFILEYTLSDWDSDLALRNGDSPAPPSKISHSGNRQYLVPGTEEPYYLEGPESKDRLDELQARYGTLDTAFFGNRKNSKRDVSSDKPGLEVSIWDKNWVLEKGLKDINHVSPVRMGHSASESDVEKPTKTISS
ncbi:hypothetical protein TWF706_001458 [Orbilia oligospora]|nr:hypothetical protein TWF706_001458 [Orbilia oligospora]